MNDHPAAPDSDAPSADRLLTVTELAKELGITPRTIRFYEDKGLITPRRAANTRIYTYRDRARMQLILRGKRLGFSLRDIKDYLDLYEVDRTKGEQVKLLLTLIRQRVARLQDQRQALEDALEELADIEGQALAVLAAQQPGKKSRAS
jgi:DNA-binding transcriptional MerR regulator